MFGSQLLCWMFQGNNLVQEVLEVGYMLWEVLMDIRVWAQWNAIRQIQTAGCTSSHSIQVGLELV